MNKDSKIYVAGHTGLVGSAIVSSLANDGFNNIITKTHQELDLTNQKETFEFFQTEKPEYVINAAAKVGGIMANTIYPADFIYQNLMIGTNIVHASYLVNVKKMINLGSSCIYPCDKHLAIKESDLLTGPLEQTNEAYAVAKIAIINLCKFYNKQYGTNFISVMPTNQYGVGDNFNLETAHVLPMVLRKFHLAKLLMENNFESIIKDLKKYDIGWGLDNQLKPDDTQSIISLLQQIGIYSNEVFLWGDGCVYREFMASNDLADACIYLLKNYNQKEIGDIVNITSGNDIKLSELFELMKKIVQYNGNIKYDNSKPNGTYRKLLDDNKIKSLGWKPKIDLETGIKNLYDWYVKTTL